jgi:tetratricopeptide (TPR) repeat protein/predicted Ser/Thr protein kinase
VRLAIERGLLSLDTVAKVQQTPLGSASLPQFLLEQRLVAPERLRSFLQEVSAIAFRCDSCGVQTSFAHLQAVPSLECTRCRRPLTQVQPFQPRASDSNLTATVTSTRAGPTSGFGFPPVGLESTHGTVTTGSHAAARPADRTVGPYVIERELGRGSNGVVYLARRQGLSRTFALKVLRNRNGVTDEESIKRFQREADVASKLQDPALIGVYDVGRDGETYYYAMEYCPGTDLKERLRAGPLPMREAAKLIRELARAIHLAHEQGVIHRDLKPANVILTGSDQQPRITDFGLARGKDLRSSLTKTGDIIGTPAYMAPEQFLGEDVDRRADIYALGGMLFELLTGQRAFTAATAAEQAEQVILSSPRSLRSVDPDQPAALESICAKALAREPAERYATAAELEADLTAYLRSSAPPNKPPASPRAPASPVAHGRVVPALVVALCLATLGVVGAALLRGGGDGEASSTKAGRDAASQEELARLLSYGDSLVLAGAEGGAALRKLIADAESLAGDDPERGEQLNAARDRWASALLEGAEEVDGVRDPVALELAAHVAPPGAESALRLAAAAERAELERSFREAVAEAYRLAASESYTRTVSTLDDVRPRLEGHPELLAQLSLERLRLAQRRGQFQAVVDGVEAASLPEELAAEAQLLRGLALWRLDRDDEAVATLKALADSQPKTGLGLTARANQLLFDDQRPEALQVAERAVEVDPQRVDAQIALAFAIDMPEAKEEEGEDDEESTQEYLDTYRQVMVRELGAFDDAIRQAPEHWRAHWGLYHALRRLESIEAVYRHYGMGGTGVRQEHRDLPSALETIRKTVTLTRPKPYFAAWLALARQLAGENQDAEAAAECEKIARVYPDRAEPWVMAAACHAYLEQTTKAAQAAERALEVDSAQASTYLQTLPEIYGELFEKALSWRE